MNSFTKLLKWAETRMDEGAWFRRFYVVAATVLTWQVVSWSFQFSREALAAKADLLGVAAVIGAIGTIAAAVQGFAFKQYLDSKKEVAT